MWSFALSVLSFLSSMSWLLPQTFSEVCLLSVVMLLSVLVKKLSDHEWVISSAWDFMDEMSKRVSFITDKLAYIEGRVDSAQSSLSDTVRHLSDHLSTYDSAIGEWSVLQRWVRQVRDQFSLRRSLSDWTMVSATAQLSCLNQLMYLRISEPGDETEETVSRVVSTLRRMRAVSSVGWAKLSGDNEDEPFQFSQVAEPQPSELAYEQYKEVLEHHKRGLRAVADEWKVNFEQVAKGLNFVDVFSTAFSQSS
jgi:hypothetical protein